MPALRVEYAKSGRSKCALKECSKAVEKGEVRIGTAKMMPGADQPSFSWRHLCCFTKRQLNAVQSVDGIEGYDDLAPEDQALIRELVQGKLIGRSELLGRVSPHGPGAGTTASPKKRARGASPSPGASPVAPAPPSLLPAAPVAPVAPPALIAVVSAVPPAAAPLVAAAPVAGQTPCKYGAQCLRTNPQHFVDFGHPPGVGPAPAAPAPAPAVASAAVPAPVAAPAAPVLASPPPAAPAPTAVAPPVAVQTVTVVAAAEGKPECRFGTMCCRTDPAHWRDHFHRGLA